VIHFLVGAVVVLAILLGWLAIVVNQLCKESDGHEKRLEEQRVIIDELLRYLGVRFEESSSVPTPNRIVPL
jgi:hypothetical protein